MTKPINNQNTICVDRQEKIAAILSKDMQQLKILKHGTPDIKTFHTEFNSGVYYDDKGDQVTREAISKEKALSPPGFISAIIVTHPIGTNVLAHLKTI